MPDTPCVRVHNGEAFSNLHAGVAPGTPALWRDAVARAVEMGGRIVALFARPSDEASSLLTAIVARDADAILEVFVASVQAEYTALTSVCPQAHWFERDVWEQRGIVPVGHPWLKPLRFSGQAAEGGGTSPGRGKAGMCGVTDFFQMAGDEVHEVAVGPVHAGIIEPGHFRFQCHGETVYHLEISLGYQHRGVQRALIGGPNRRSVHYMETLAGDTSVGHALAYCLAIEGLSQTSVSPRAQVIRGIGLELERVANHVGDLGALAGDVGYLPTMSYCGRIRGDVLNLTGLLCGNRFGRGLVRPGGVAFDVDAETVSQLKRRIRQIGADARSAVDLLWSSPSVMARFERTGSLTRATCARLGLVGVAARACGVPRDVRKDFAFGIYRFAQIPVSTWHSGDVFARAFVRWLEVQRSLTFIQAQLDSLPAGPLLSACGPLKPESTIITMTEGWRGEVCHVVTTDSAGRFAHYQVVDPSFHNWFGLAMALRNQPISDFPLCNKSFSLSYCGHDL
ncbi:MAG: hydrogenase large subunit [Pirellulaceae bacterium]